MPADVTVAQLLDLVGKVVDSDYADVELDADTPLLTTGMVSSLSLAELQELLEDEFGVRLEPNELGYDNADTVRQLAETLSQRLTTVA